MIRFDDPVGGSTITAGEPLALGAVEAARMLGIGTRTLWTLTKSGEIPHARVGRRVLYPLHDLRQWLAARTRGSDET
jgi:excisionase family DNA binding protein